MLNRLNLKPDAAPGGGGAGREIAGVATTQRKSSAMRSDLGDPQNLTPSRIATAQAGGVGLNPAWGGGGGLGGWVGGCQVATGITSLMGRGATCTGTLIARRSSKSDLATE